MRGIYRTILDFIFPKRCVGCHRSGSYICLPCARTLPPCAPITATWIMALWSYKYPLVKRLLWQMKFGRRFAIAADVALAASDHLMLELSDRALFEGTSSLVLVPIPLSKKRARERGYNQSAILARELGGLIGPLPVESLLTKVRETDTQHSIGHRGKRLTNLRGAYVASPSTAGKHILLIDDITTTHATFIEARRALKAAGAKKVLAFAVAH